MAVVDDVLEEFPRPVREKIRRMWNAWPLEARKQLALVLEGLNPSRYVATDDAEPPLPLEVTLALPAQAEEARAVADAELDRVLAELGLAEWRQGQVRVACARLRG